MEIRSVFTRNWPYKVAAIILSVLLWLRVSADAEVAEQAVPTLLELQVSDSAWSISELSPAEITTTFRGPRNQVFAVRFEETILRKVIDQVQDTIVRVPLAASEVIYNRELGVEPVAVSPAAVTVRLEERVGKWVQVAGRTDARAAPGAFVSGIRTAPGRVWLQGPASFVNQISQVSTELLEAGSVSRDVSQQLAIALPPDLAGLSVDPTTVLGTVYVDSLSTRQLEAAVVAAAAEEAAPGIAPPVVLDPEFVQVTLTGPSAIVDGLDPSDIGLLVDIPAGFDGVASFPVRVVLPEDLDRNITVNVTPARVRAVPGPASPGRHPTLAVRPAPAVRAAELGPSTPR